MTNRDNINPPVLGMIMVVRNEERFLRKHLAYHHWAGIDHACLYLHECTDSSEEIARSFPWVKTFRLTGRLPDSMNYISELHRLAMDHALQQARLDGVDWLLIIDADEFACAGPPPCHPQPDRTPAPGGLKQLFDGLPGWVQQVKLPTYEVLPSRAMISESFESHDLFVCPGKLVRHIHDPLRGTDLEWSGFYGHEQGQSFVRTRENVRAFDSHRWAILTERGDDRLADYAPLRTVERGWHAHFYLASAEHWLEKFNKHNDYPGHWPGREPIPLEAPVRLWRECASKWEHEKNRAYEYCHQHLFADEQTITEGIAAGQLGRVDELKTGIRLALECETSPTTRNADVPVLSLRELAQYRPAPTITSAGTDWDTAGLATEKLDGFYDIEIRNGIPYRWCRPNASVRGHLPAGRYYLRLDVLPDVRDALLASWPRLAINRSPLKLRPSATGFFSSVFRIDEDSSALLELSARALADASTGDQPCAIPVIRFRFIRTDKPYRRILLSESAGWLASMPGRILSRIAPGRGNNLEEYS